MSEQKGPGGAPSLYDDDYPRQARELVKLGATMPTLAQFFKVNVRTIEQWLVRHPEFNRAIKPTKAIADKNVERALYQRAVGYSHMDVKIFYDSKTGETVTKEYEKHVAPDVTACIFWLRNRAGDRWNNKDQESRDDMVKALKDIAQNLPD